MHGLTGLGTETYRPLSGRPSAGEFALIDDLHVVGSNEVRAETHA